MQNEDAIRVMVVDDSAVIRGFLTRFLESDPAIKVVSSAANGQMALDSMDRHQFDVIVLDIEMPVMTGMQALPLIIKKDPDVQVIIASTLSLRNAQITLEALAIGAAECLAKPSSTQELSGTSGFRESLILKAKELGIVARRRRGMKPPTPASGATAQKSAPATSLLSPTKILTMRRDPITPLQPEAIAIGSSTGGPQALLDVFGSLKEGFRQPVFLTQHMPATFTSILADHIAKKSGLVCAEGVDGEEVRPGRIYVAPGNYHMCVRVENKKKFITLNQDPPENFCRPAVDPMLRSLVEAYGRRILAVILTGMGQDGLKGGQAVAAAEGVLIAQDEASSVVWGMPGAVAKAGICTRIVPLSEIAKGIRDFAGTP